MLDFGGGEYPLTTSYDNIAVDAKQALANAINRRLHHRRGPAVAMAMAMPTMVMMPGMAGPQQQAMEGVSPQQMALAMQIAQGMVQQQQQQQQQYGAGGYQTAGYQPGYAPPPGTSSPPSPRTTRRGRCV